MTIDRLLKKIQTEKADYIYQLVTQQATLWTLGGYLKEANQLLEKLWNLNVPHSGHVWSFDDAFQIQWTITGLEPNNLPFTKKTIEEIEARNWHDNVMPTWFNREFDNQLRNPPLEEIPPEKLLLRAKSLSYDSTVPDFSSTPENRLAALQALDKYLETFPNEDKGWAMAAIIAGRLGFVDKATDYVIGWGKSIKKKDIDFIKTYIMRDMSTGKIISTGILSKVLNLNRDQIIEDLDKLTSGLNNRFTSGQTLLFSNKNWKELLLDISKLAVDNDRFEFPQQVQKSKWLGSVGATQSEIENAEKRLNTKLPKEYVEFLLTSNGFECYSHVGVTLMPVDKIDWFINADKDLVLTFSSALVGIDDDFVGKFKKSLLIGGLNEEQQLLLIPSDKTENWECWQFATWNPGAMEYPSFRFYMESELEELQSERMEKE